MKEILEDINNQYEVYITYVSKLTGTPTAKILTLETEEYLKNLIENDKTRNSK